MAYLTPTVEREELGGGRVRVTVHAAAVAYDDGGTLRPIVTNWVDSGVVARPHLVSAAKVMVSAGDDGMRRIHPTHEADRYLEIGAPYVRVGGVWTQVSLGTPTRSANLITWTRPQTITRIMHGGHFIKLDIELLGGYMPANRQVAFPVGINGLTRDGLNILRDGVAVGRLNPFVLEDAANPEDVRPIAHQFTTLNGQPYLLLTLPDSAGMARPRIDPTYTDGYGGDVTTYIDTYLRKNSVDTNEGTATLLAVGNYDASNNQRASLIKFDLSGIPGGATIDSATLTLVAASNGATPAGTTDSFRINRCLRAWVESEATWNIYSTGNSWATAGCRSSGTDYAAATLWSGAAYTALDVTGESKDFALDLTEFASLMSSNNGMVIDAGVSSSTTTGIFYAGSSDNATTGYRPKLVVVYTEAGGGVPKQAMHYARARQS